MKIPEVKKTKVEKNASWSGQFSGDWEGASECRARKRQYRTISQAVVSFV